MRRYGLSVQKGSTQHSITGNGTASQVKAGGRTVEKKTGKQRKCGLSGKNSALRCAFPKTVPVMIGYLFLGTAYGILMSVNGYGIGWAVLTSVIVYAGSLQYVGIDLLSAAVHPVAAFVMALMVNARHLFYGISMLGKYQEVKKDKAYLIFGLTDETFSIVCNEDVPSSVPEERLYFWITFLDQCYWVGGTLLGAAAGSLIRFNTAGLDFALTALFVMIFTEQWLTAPRRWPAAAGVICSVVCLLLFGREAFIIPAMAAILGVVTVGYRKERTSHEQ